ncbi:hypothetical protein BCR32DRAFT_272206 [Anaeromyces robustus]|uniref:Glycoside hydrolase n=1 Tax=Anaeromyces robustus TaxID=1754192 RepID=A0A1Y1WJC9_9FUNG|nr:hypothetical protein BCR32DRAFT_272206 [Anaeromyces robustus]|eukprot:ORX73438.1 hypothetical protein BCR32DRAFT_272206 [Anaeromyces robustus]
MNKLLLIILIISNLTYIRACISMCGYDKYGDFYGSCEDDECCINGFCDSKKLLKQKVHIYAVIDATYRMKENMGKIQNIVEKFQDKLYEIGALYYNVFNNEKVSNTSGGYIMIECGANEILYEKREYDSYDFGDDFDYNLYSDGDFVFNFDFYNPDRVDESFNSKANNIPMEKAFKNGCDFLIKNSKKEKKVLLFINSGFPYYSKAVTSGDKNKWTTKIMKNIGNIATKCKNNGVDIYVLNVNEKADINKKLNTKNGKITINVENNVIDNSLTNEFMQVLSSNYKITNISNTKTKVEYTIKKVNSNYYKDEKHVIKSNGDWSVTDIINFDNLFEKVKNNKCYVEYGCDPNYLCWNLFSISPRYFN